MNGEVVKITYGIRISNSISPYRGSFSTVAGSDRRSLKSRCNIHTTSVLNGAAVTIKELWSALFGSITRTDGHS